MMFQRKRHETLAIWALYNVDIHYVLKFLSISRTLVSLIFCPFRVSIISLSISVMLLCCSLALLPFVNYVSLRICCIISLRFYNRLIYYIYLLYV